MNTRLSTFVMLMLLFFSPFEANAQEIMAEPGDSIIAENFFEGKSAPLKVFNKEGNATILFSGGANKITEGKHFRVAVTVDKNHAARSLLHESIQLFVVTTPSSLPTTREGWLKTKIPYKKISVQLDARGGILLSKKMTADSSSLGVDSPIYAIAAITNFKHGPQSKMAAVAEVFNEHNKIIGFAFTDYIPDALFKKVDYRDANKAQAIQSFSGDQQVRLFGKVSKTPFGERPCLHSEYIEAKVFVRRNGRAISELDFKQLLRLIGDDFSGWNLFWGGRFNPLISFGNILEDGDKLVGRIDHPCLEAPVETSIVYIKPKPDVLSVELLAVEGTGGDKSKDKVKPDGSFEISVKMRNRLVEDEINIDVRFKGKEKVKQTFKLSAKRQAGTPNIYKTKSISLSKDKRFKDITGGDVIEAQAGETWPWSKGTRLEIIGRDTGRVNVQLKGSDYDVYVYKGQSREKVLQTNEPFDLKPGKYKLRVEMPVPFTQEITVEANADYCVDIASKLLGSLKIGKSVGEGSFMPMGASFDPVKELPQVDSWCKGAGPKPKSWVKGKWGIRGGIIGDREKYDLPAGEYIFDEKRGNSRFEIHPGKLTSIITEMGTVKLTAKDYKGAPLSNAKFIIDGSSFSNGIAEPLKVGQHSYQLKSGKVTVDKSIAVTYGCRCSDTIETGRILFEKADHYPDYNIKMSGPSFVGIEALSPGEHVDLPPGIYTYKYSDQVASEDKVRVAVNANTKKTIKAPVLNGTLSIVWPRIIKNTGQFRNWKFEIFAKSISEKNKIKLSSHGGKLKKGKYLLYIKGNYSARRETPGGLFVDPMEVNIEPGKSTSIKIKLGKLKFEQLDEINKNFKITKSGRFIAERYISRQYPHQFLFLSPGSYQVIEIDNPSNRWSLDLSADEEIKVH